MHPEQAHERRALNRRGRGASGAVRLIDSGAISLRSFRRGMDGRFEATIGNSGYARRGSSSCRGGFRYNGREHAHVASGGTRRPGHLEAFDRPLALYHLVAMHWMHIGIVADC